MRAAGKERCIMTNEKYCTKCGKKFIPVGREVICPACRESAKLEAKRAAVLKAKKASWTGESVPVRISGRASTLIRKYGEEKSLPFAQALDALLQSTAFFVDLDTEWSTIQPYKSRRMKKSAETAQEAQDVPQQDVQVQEAQEARLMRQIKKAVIASKTAGKAAKTSKTSKTVKAAKATKAAGRKEKNE